MQTTSVSQVRVKGKKQNIRSKSLSSTFKSTTDRAIYQHTSLEVKKCAPDFGSYEETRTIGSIKVEGGAPNNFLLLRNDKLAAPFGSTVKKGWLHEERGKLF